MYKNIYVFIDAQNLYLGIKYQGWELNYEKFHVYLKEKYRASAVFIYLGYISGNKKLYKSLRDIGYNIVFKQTTKYRRGNKVKGNVDVDLTVDAIRKVNDYDKAIFVSADGDFCALYEYITTELEKEIIIMIPNRYKYSRLLLKYRSNLRYMNDLKDKLGK